MSDGLQWLIRPDLRLRTVRKPRYQPSLPSDTGPRTARKPRRAARPCLAALLGRRLPAVLASSATRSPPPLSVPPHSLTPPQPPRSLRSLVLRRSKLRRGLARFARKTLARDCARTSASAARAPGRLSTVMYAPDSPRGARGGGVLRRWLSHAGGSRQADSQRFGSVPGDESTRRSRRRARSDAEPTG